MPGDPDCPRVSRAALGVWGGIRLRVAEAAVRRSGEGGDGGATVRVLAAAVERDNGGRLMEGGWWDLARGLGPLGRSAKGGGGKGGSKKRKRYCERGRNCAECGRLQRSRRYRIDHRKIERRRKSKTWWGKLPVEW